ncbi:hypothetical protein [Arthrobacter sp. TMS1-12-1]
MPQGPLHRDDVASSRDEGRTPWTYKGSDKRDAWQILRDTEAAAKRTAWQEQIVLPTGVSRSAGTILGYVDTNVNNGFAAPNAKVDGLVGALAAVAGGESFDQAKLLASIEEATRRGVLAAVGSVTEEKVTVVTMKDEAEG